MVPEIWSRTDITFFNSGPFFALLSPPPVPTPHMDPENQNFGKMKKTPEDNIILHTEMTVIMMYPS